MRTLFFNANIYPLFKRQSKATAMVVEDGVIKALGRPADFTGINEQIDLDGNTVIPGFNDSHLHLLSIGEAMENLDLTGSDSPDHLRTSLQDLIEGQKIKPGEWIKGRGWDQNFYPGRTLPDKRLLDSVSPANPVILQRACCHLAVVNSLALKLAGISKNTPDPPGGVIDRYPGGNEPTGILRENAINLVANSIAEPKPAYYKERIAQAAGELSRHGVTSVQTDDFGSQARFKVIYQVYQELKNEGRLPLRVNLKVRMGNQAEFEELVTATGIKTGTGDQFLEIGPCKILADGSMGGRTAALSAPYHDQADSCGVLIYPPDELQAYISCAARHGFQLAVHGIGDRAISIILDCYQTILGEEAGRSRLSLKEAALKLRPRIVHGQLTNPDLIRRIAELGICLDIQPIFLNSDLHIAEERLGPERIKGAYAWKTMLAQGIHLAGGSDGPVDSFIPLEGVYSAVCRRDLQGYPSGGWQREEALDIDQAIELFTRAPAYHSFAEKEKGTLQPGQLADFIVLAENPFQVEPERLKQIKVLASYVGGERVYPSP
ncbi:MAG: amidohydrolase [Halanaerobiales bacterium]|nr:amidohydrolase [Halanaerobiales bacterium]